MINNVGFPVADNHSSWNTWGLLLATQAEKTAERTVVGHLLLGISSEDRLTMIPFLLETY